jgi:N-carbamoyl-L-amino-acid hydrolase
MPDPPDASPQRDARYAASELAVFTRKLALDMAGDQVVTTGTIILTPNLVNVVPKQAIVDLDIRNTDNDLLIGTKNRLDEFAKVAASGKD